MEETIEQKPEKEKYAVSVINRNHIRKVTAGFKVTPDYLDKLESQVNLMIKNSMVRASGNRRTTLMPRDL